MKPIGGKRMTISDDDAWAEFWARGYRNDDGEPRLYPDDQKPECFGEYGIWEYSCKRCEHQSQCFTGIAKAKELGGGVNENMSDSEP